MVKRKGWVEKRCWSLTEDEMETILLDLLALVRSVRGFLEIGRRGEQKVTNYAYEVSHKKKVIFPGTAI